MSANLQLLQGVQVLDCTIRDGGYLNDWQYSEEQVAEIYRTAVAAGVDYLELGYFRVSPIPQGQGQWVGLTPEIISKVLKNRDPKKRPMLVSMIDYVPSFDISQLPTAEESGITLVRIVARKSQVIEAIDFAEKLQREKGYMVAVNCMAIATTSFAERWSLAMRLTQSTIDIFYCADSYGSLFPNDIEELFSPFVFAKKGSELNKQRTAPLKLGFHPHNNLQLAFANTLEAIRVGFDFVDCTMLGMGRGPGNLCTEIFLAYAERIVPNKYNVIPVLEYIERHLMPMFNAKPWGYHPTFVASAMLNMHPNYVSYLVPKLDSYSSTWQVLDQIKARAPAGYQPDLIHSVLTEGKFQPLEQPLGVDPVLDAKATALPPLINEPAWYVNKHVGKKFLVLANGPSLDTHKQLVRSYIEQEQPIIIGTNNLTGTVQPDYHVFARASRLEQYASSVSASSTLVVGCNLADHPVLERLPRVRKVLYFHDSVVNSVRWDDNGVISSNCGSTALLAIAMALVMGASDVAIAGLDGYLHLLNDQTEVKDNRMFFYEQGAHTAGSKNEREALIMQHWLNEGYLSQLTNTGKQAGIDVHIITPTTHKKFYRGIDNYLKV